jgi:type III pantothenate kinase
MEFNLLILNLNNTRLGMGAFVAGELTHVTRIPNTQHHNWVGRIKDTWAAVSGREDPTVVATSVNPPMAALLEKAVRDATGQKIHWVGKDVPLPIPVLTDKPELTGIDRVVNLAAAYEQLGKACVVVDAGTAITIDLCDDAGRFVGGVIFPGVRMMLDALHEKTAQLPKLDFAVPAHALGKNTTEAIRSGVYHGIRGLVREVAEQFATDLGTWPDVIATGGDAHDLFEGWEVVHAVSPDLAFYGTALAWAKHKEA